jgi:hypothetical protein
MTTCSAVFSELIFVAPIGSRLIQNNELDVVRITIASKKSYTNGQFEVRSANQKVQGGSVSRNYTPPVARHSHRSALVDEYRGLLSASLLGHAA